MDGDRRDEVEREVRKVLWGALSARAQVLRECMVTERSRKQASFEHLLGCLDPS
jgi:hypothetical protein